MEVFGEGGDDVAKLQLGEPAFRDGRVAEEGAEQVAGYGARGIGVAAVIDGEVTE